MIYKQKQNDHDQCMHVKLNKLYFDRKSVAKSDHGVMVMKKYIERERERERGKVRVECGEEGVERQRMYTGELARLCLGMGG